LAIDLDQQSYFSKKRLGSLAEPLKGESRHVDASTPRQLVVRRN
jgi:hypothetical protein